MRRVRLEPENDTVSYVAYEQKGIRIQGDMVSIRLMNDAPENHGYGESGAGSRIGVLAMGDIDGVHESISGKRNGLCDHI